MLKVEKFKSFQGFGDGAKYPYGECVHSVGMNKSQNGIAPGWNVVSAMDSSSLTGLEKANWFTQATPASTMYVWGAATDGKIYQSQGGFGAWAHAYHPGQTTYGNGLIGDQEGRLLYPMTRYLGKYDGTADYTTGTIAVTNGSANIVGTGTTFTSGMVNKRIVIAGVWYTIATFTDATHIALSANYAGSTASGLSYAIKVGWDDLFKDFGANSLPADSDYRPSDTYEDWAVFGNGNELAVLNVTDDSFNASAFTLPSKFLVRAVKSGRTGLLVGANIGNRSILFLWDAQATRSLAPWIWLNGNIQSIASHGGDWIVITNRQILRTNGYTLDEEEFAPVPDSVVSSSYLSVLPQGAEVMGRYLFLANSVSGVNRVKSGLWILNLITRLWEYAPTSNGAMYNNNMGAVFFDSAFRTHVSWASTIPAKKHVGYINNAASSRASLITSPMGTGNFQKVSEGVKLNLGISPIVVSSGTFNLTVSVKVYNFKRLLWGYAQQKVNASTANQITVDGTLSGINNAQVGDEVTILEGTNAGQIAHISSISGQDTSTEVWTLNKSLTGNTEQDVLMQVMPFKLIKEHALTSLTELKELYFNSRNKIQGQKYLLKIVVENIGSIPVELLEGEFYYDDLGAFTTN